MFKPALCFLALALIAAGAHAQIQPITREYSPVSPAGTTKETRSAARNATTAAVPEDFSKLLLAPGFLLDLQVYDMPEISSQLRIDDAGDVAVPLSGPVHIAGLTLAGAQAAIDQKLVSSGILLHPRTNLDIVQYAGGNVTVIGEVQSPGRLPLLAPHRLDDVLAMAGGETQLAGNTIELTRASGEKTTLHYDRIGAHGGGVTIQPGDTILVPRAGIVYVLGGVNRPGGYLLQEDGTLNVIEALSAASGTAVNAAVGSIHIVRKNPDGSLAALPVPYGKITAGKAEALALRDGDILYVPVSKFKTVLTAGIATSASSALIYSLR